MKRNVKIIAAILIVLTLSGAIGYRLLDAGVIWFQDPSKDQYPVRGVDVSSYQGEIDWHLLADQNLHFAFIKSTEGSGWQDPYYHANWKKAQETPLVIGAYHFFSFDSPGETQAGNIISTVPLTDGMLPIVIDVEFYENRPGGTATREECDAILKPLLAQLELFYGQTPILYATKQSYELYLSGDYEAYPLWIRDIIVQPKVSDDREYVFWQYSNRGRLEGYSGSEPFIDLNVFCGAEEEFEAFCAANCYNEKRRESS